MTASDQTELEEAPRFGKLVGYRLVEWRDGYAELVLDLDDRHMNRSGLVHGGVHATLLDVVCGYAGVYTAVEGNVRASVTVSLTINYKGRASGGRLRAIGRHAGGGRSMFFASGEVQDETGAVVASAEGIFKYRKGSEDPNGVPAGTYR